MALLSLSDRLRFELEEIVCHTAGARKRCRAQALLWLAEGAGIEQVAEALHVSRQTVYNWVSRFQQSRREPSGAVGVTGAVGVRPSFKFFRPARR
jgi:Homeodomain-like domain